MDMVQILLIITVHLSGGPETVDKIPMVSMTECMNAMVQILNVQHELVQSGEMSLQCTDATET